ncbi:MAG: glycosyltransferase [Robiginitomaculum sp.]|nr:glycosyltransferase [Robiginitomaculum sp.]
MKPLLIIFTKAPIMGKAKTRLAAGIGRVHAWRIYRAMCAKIFRNCTDPRWDTVLFVTPDDKIYSTFGGVWPERLPRIPQGSGGLSARLAKIYTHKGPLIVIGTDTPQQNRNDIAQGFKALKTHACVFGPATDGGFWLMGMDGPVPKNLFEDIRWSHPETLKDMQAKIIGPVTRLRRLTDVDDAKALRQVMEKP